MRGEQLRYFFAYDRWATRRVLDAAARLADDEWRGGAAIGRRSLAPILVHALGAHERWRSAWMGLPIPGARERRRRLPDVAELGDAWEAEWRSLDAMLDAMADDRLAGPIGGSEDPEDRMPMWLTMLHVLNHDTQHRSEAAVLLTAAGRSPGELDLIDYASAHEAWPG